MASQMSDQGTQAKEQSQPHIKRRRIALACSACRVRKSRCDGRRPSCSTCSSLALECVYETSEYSTNILVRKEYVSDFEQRLKEIERALQRHDDLLTGHLSSCSTNLEPDSTGNQVLDPSLYPTVQIQDSIYLDPSSVKDPGNDEAKTDGLATVFVDGENSTFYGESSNIVFTRYLFQALSWQQNTMRDGNNMISDNSSEKLGLTQACSVFQPSNMRPVKHAKQVPDTLPSVEEMDALVGTYFSSYGTIFPFLHESTFRRAYEDYKRDDFAEASRTWLGLLNMTFAIASHVDQSTETPAKERFSKSHRFFLRAMSLCRGSSTRSVSLELVQYLLLAMLHLMGTQSIQTWTVHGILVRTAMALGLYSEQSGLNFDPVQQETRQRTWQSIYCLDKMLSVAFGRPPSIPDEYLVVKLPMPWASSRGTTGALLQDMDLNTHFFNASVRLYQIVGRSITTQYSMNLGLMDQETDDSAAILVANARRQELRKWILSLPPQMALCGPGSEILVQQSDSNRLRVILTLRYHFASILIHRPLLCAILRFLALRKHSTETSMPYTMQLAMAEAYECINSAANTIKIIHTVLTAQATGQNNLGAWFFTLFYTFTASLVVLGCSVLVQRGAYNAEDPVGKSPQSLLQDAIEALKRLDVDNHYVHKCLNFIRHLCEVHFETDLHRTVIEQHNRHLSSKHQSGSPDGVSAQAAPSLEFPPLTGLVADDLELFQNSDPGLFGQALGASNLDLDHLSTWL